MVKFFSHKAAPAADLSGVGFDSPTGLVDLDEALAGGLKPGQVVVLAGPTGGGKSALASQIALSVAHWATDHGGGRSCSSLMR